MDQSSNAKRIVVGLIALYAILLQGFVAAALPVMAFDSRGVVVCAQDAAVPQAPTDERRHHHGACCILACAASGFAFVAAACGLIVFARPAVSPFVFASTWGMSARAPRKYYFAARGPPRSA